MENTGPSRGRGRQYPMLPVADTVGADKEGTPLIASERESASDGDRLESIYNLIAKPKKEKKKAPLYRRSTAHRTKDNEATPYSTFALKGTKGGGIFGIKDGARPHDPKNYLKCGEGLDARRKAGKRPERPRLKQLNEDRGGSGGDESARRAELGMQQPLVARRKPAVPRRDERPTLGLKSDKDFVTANAVDAILAAPGNRRLPPVNYLAKEDYGRVPEYLSHVKEEIRAENEMVEEFVRHQMGITNHTTKRELTEIPREEQDKLVGQLKTKWEEVNARYQRLSHQTIFEHGCLKAKARLEKELDEIEAYIAKLSHGPVAVAP